MQTRIVGGVTESRINPKELTPETYLYYCKLYLIEEISKIIPCYSKLEYRHVCKLVNVIDPVLFSTLGTETGKLLLLNKIYSLFREACGLQLERSILYNMVSHIAKYDPSLY